MSTQSVSDLDPTKTCQGKTKPAKVETGLIVQVPAFIGSGEKIRVSTTDGSYLERA